MGAGKTAESHCIEALAWEAGISNAIEVTNARAIERHRQKTGELHRRNRAVTSLKTSKEASMAARRADLLVGDRLAKARKDRFEALDQSSGIRLFFGSLIRGGQPLP